MISTFARLLRLVSLLSARPSWTCGELAGRMEVTERTVRRDIARLRELGYGVESEPGPGGGYRLGGRPPGPPRILHPDAAHPGALPLRAAERPPGL
ncbi:helix-turn-helix domain-containing protein, partial [Streptomyces sp. NPDC002671]